MIVSKPSKLQPLKALFALAVLLIAQASPGRAEARPPAEVRTRSPIKHLIVVIGENRSFDHIFGLYRPRAGQTISNLLSKGIVNADGAPGPHFVQAAQFQVAPQTVYYISAPHKTAYPALPPPGLAGTPNQRGETFPPFTTVAEAALLEPALEPADEFLLTTGASGLAQRLGLDTRIANGRNLPDGPFRLKGPDLPYDSYTGDTIHRFYQMWQQLDCDSRNATQTNPSGCLSDLYPFVDGTAWFPSPESGNPMAFYNVNRGDAPYLKKLADEYTSSDNFHQSVMGGTGANHIMLGTGDAIFFTNGEGKPVPPPQLIANPNPQPGTNNRYILDGMWSNCSDSSQPGVAPILSY